MDRDQAIERVLLGEPLKYIAQAHREELLVSVGLDLDEAQPSTFAKETRTFMNNLCRFLGERHVGDSRVGSALADWVQIVDDYDAFDSLLVGFEFDGRDAVVRRGRTLFPGPLTAHWDD